MKLIFTLTAKKILTALAVAALLSLSANSYSQVSIVCTDPTNTVYGLSNSGQIMGINSNTAATVATVKNSSYPGNSTSSSNGIGYNTFNSTFYYFKRNVGASPQEFVSFRPATNTVTVLANSTCTDEIHTGCVSYNGAGYYTIDVQGTLHYYNIAANSWTFITSSIVDQFGADVSSIIKTQNAGDMAIDGLGRIWLVTSSDANWGLYRFPGPMPTVPVASITVTRVMAPTQATPTGNSFAGIAFKPDGRIFMSTRSDNRLYLLQNNLSLLFIGTFTTNNIGNDLTSCSFPTSVLPISWKSFDVAVKNNNNVVLKWEVAEDAQNKGYYVQHSLNGSDWEDISFVTAKNYTESIQEYSYSHINNLDGKQYYRIRQVEQDNKMSYSEVRSVVLKNEKQTISVWPNPATDHIRIASTAGSANHFTKAQLFDLSGKMIAERKLQTNINTISISELPAGTYLVRVQANDGTSYSQKIIKQ
ncbi:MAG TPA: T9SS type A sorting domain-containing protein [Chitinophagaceae bacterium]